MGNLPQTLLQQIPWSQGTDPIWPLSTFTLHRNLNKTLFPSKLGEQEMKQIFLLLKQGLQTTLESPLILGAEELEPTEKEWLYEHFLCTDSFQNSLAGEGFAFDQSGELLALLNIQDHLQITLLDPQGKWEGVWNRLNQLETKITTALPFAFCPKFGYLTSNPSLAGTGLVVRAYLHLPALVRTNQLPETDEGVISSSLLGPVDESVGDIIVLKNRFTSGVSEEKILQEIHGMAMKLISLERALRTHMKEDLPLKDQISRAYGLLLHSYQLQAKETLDALSLIKLGISLGHLTGIEDQKLSSLFFCCRKAHLSQTLGEKDPEKLSHERAVALHQALSGLVLNEKKG